MDKEAFYEEVKLHDRKDLAASAAALLNTQWRRSEAARMAAFERSCDGMPLHWLLIEPLAPGGPRVVAHLRIARSSAPVDTARGNAAAAAPSAATWAMIESVVVAQDRRGRGLGARLMRHAEAHARDALGVSRVVLSTISAAEFYERIGYIRCPPGVAPVLGTAAGAAGADAEKFAALARIFGGRGGRAPALPAVDVSASPSALPASDGEVGEDVVWLSKAL